MEGTGIQGDLTPAHTSGRGAGEPAPLGGAAGVPGGTGEPRGRLVRCPGCGVELPDRRLAACDTFRASGECWELYGELSAYTLSLMDRDFIHQLCTDSYAAQHSGESVKPITTVFALVGLHLAVERGFTGRQVQRAHMVLARRTGRRVEWPRMDPPPRVGEVTVLTVMRARAGDERAARIRDWASDVWKSWADQHERIRAICQDWIFRDR